MSSKHRKKIIRTINNEKNLELLSSNGLSFNSSSASMDIVFKQGVIGHIDSISIISHKHNAYVYKVIFFDIDGDILDERLLTTDRNKVLSIDNVAKMRFIFLETSDGKNINGVKLSIRGCFFKMKNLKTTIPTTTASTKPWDYCHPVDLMNKHYAKVLLTSVGGTLKLPQLLNSTKYNGHLLYFILEFKKNIIIRRIQNISILTKHHSIEKIRIELLNTQQQLLKRIDVSMFTQIAKTNLYYPNYPVHVQYLKVIILKGKPNKTIHWSIVGCFDRIKTNITTTKNSTSGCERGKP